MHRDLLSREAQKIYETANPSLAKKIARCLEQLEQKPRFHANIKPLKGNMTGYYRYRIGDYRVIYWINDDTEQVMVNTIVHRRNAYE